MRCGHGWRLAVSGIRVELREISLKAKPADMLAVSSKGTVPVLVLSDGEVIDESLAIMRWALAINDPEHWLDRDDTDLIAANDGPFKEHLDRYKYPQRYAVDPLPFRERGLAFLREIDALGGGGGPTWRRCARAQRCGHRSVRAPVCGGGPGHGSMPRRCRICGPGSIAISGPTCFA